MATSPAIVRAAFACSVAALAAAALALGRVWDRPPAVPPPTPASGLVAASGVIPDGGSFYYARVANGAKAVTRIQGALFTERLDECSEGCPVGMKMIEGPEALVQGSTAVSSVGGTLDALAAAAAGPAPDFAAALRAVRTRQATWGAPVAPRPRRVFALGMPRPDYGDTATMVVFAAYDHCDPVFDANRVEDCPSGGTHALIARIERPTESGREVVAGLVEVEERPTGAGEGDVVVAGTDAVPVMSVVSPIYMHFGAGRRGRVQGLFLDAKGDVFSFGADRAPHALPRSDALRDALIAALKRA